MTMRDRAFVCALLRVMAQGTYTLPVYIVIEYIIFIEHKPQSQIQYIRHHVVVQRNWQTLPSQVDHRGGGR